MSSYLGLMLGSSPEVLGADYSQLVARSGGTCISESLSDGPARHSQLHLSAEFHDPLGRDLEVLRRANGVPSHKNE
jgi:hypothetical protein